MSGASAKDLIVRPISAAEANALVKRVHYSGKVVQNSQIHMGVFWNGKLEGAMQFGPSLDKRKLVGLVAGTKWNEFIELNRMAFGEALPRNSESRAIAVAMRILRKHAPHLRWVVSFADGTQCGDGTIYRASGFVLTSVRANEGTWQLPQTIRGLDPRDTRIVEQWAASTGYQAHVMSVGGSGVRPSALLREVKNIMRRYMAGASAPQRFFELLGAQRFTGYQLRYVYFLDPSCRDRLTVPVLPFSEIERVGAGMYRGKPTKTTGDGDIMPIATTPRATSIESDALSDQDRDGGASPTVALPPTSGKTPKGGRKHGRKA